uniref:Uncharacterized protein n=1 Tax=viral metagenome TaxID=1070528 RepID=A0A6C0H7E2_9ZZZZ
MKLYAIFCTLIAFGSGVNGHCNGCHHKCRQQTVTKIVTNTVTLQPTPPPSPPSANDIPINSGNRGTLTYFTDGTTQCFGSNLGGIINGLAVNPLLLGFTTADWTNKFANAEPSQIPWCGKQMRITINGKTFTGTIIDTCNPTGNPFTDPVTGQSIGGKCSYDDVIDLTADRD